MSNPQREGFVNAMANQCKPECKPLLNRHIEADMVTQSQLIDMFEYRDGGLYWKISLSNRIQAGARAGTPNSGGYRQVCVNRKLYLEHRLIYMMHHGTLPAFLDHINGNKLDNRVENLRPCTSQQNGYNAKTPRNNTSGVKGVDWRKKNNKWAARISLNGRQRHLGLFNTIEEAKIVLDSARGEHHGAFAKA